MSRKSKSYNGKFSPPLALIKNKKDIKKNNKKGKNSNKSNNNDNASNKIKKNSKDSTYKKSIRKEETTAEDVENSEIIRGKTGLGSKSKISKNLESSAKITLLSTLIEGKKKSSIKKDIAIEDSGKKKRNKEEEEEELCPFDSIIFLGDLNYRLDLPRLEVRAREMEKSEEKKIGEKTRREKRREGLIDEEKLREYKSCICMLFMHAYLYVCIHM